MSSSSQNPRYMEPLPRTICRGCLQGSSSTTQKHKLKKTFRISEKLGSNNATPISQTKKWNNKKESMCMLRKTMNKRKLIYILSKRVVIRVYVYYGYIDITLHTTHTPLSLYVTLTSPCLCPNFFGLTNIREKVCLKHVSSSLDCIPSNGWFGMKIMKHWN